MLRVLDLLRSIRYSSRPRPECLLIENKNFLGPWQSEPSVFWRHTFENWRQ